MLKSYPDLVSWAQAAGLLTKNEGEAMLILKGEQNPIFAAKTLSKALDLRKSPAGVLYSATPGASPGEADLSVFNQHLSDALLHSKIASSGDRFSWSWDNAELHQQDHLDTGQGGEPDYFRGNQPRRRMC